MQTFTNENQSAPPSTPSRKRFTPQQREQLVRSYLESGLSQEQFVTRQGISVSALSKWLGDYRRQARRVKASVKFQEVPLASFKPAWTVEISTPGNWTLRLAQVPSPATLQQLLRALPC